jgi:hypothetical protein
LHRAAAPGENFVQRQEPNERSSRTFTSHNFTGARRSCDLPFPQNSAK